MIWPEAGPIRLLWQTVSDSTFPELDNLLFLLFFFLSQKNDRDPGRVEAGLSGRKLPKKLITLINKAIPKKIVTFLDRKNLINLIYF